MSSPTDLSSTPKPTTRTVTLYRLANVDPTEEGMRGVFDADQLAQQNLELQTTRIDGCPAVVVSGVSRKGPPAWLQQARRSTGLELELTRVTPAVAVLIEVDGAVYAFSYGMGHWLIPYDRRDPDFGRRFATRALDPHAVQEIHTRFLASEGRYASTGIIKGSSLRTYALRHERELVNRIRAKCGVSDLTATRNGTKPKSVACGEGITVPLGVEPADLVNDIRFIAAVIEEGSIHDELAALEDQKEVKSPQLRARLWRLLQDSARDDPEAVSLEIAPPSELLPSLGDARSFSLRFGPKTLVTDQEALFDLFVERIRKLPEQAELEERLSRGEIRLYEDEDGRCDAEHFRNLRSWVEATVHDGPRMYALRNGRWYEYGARLLDEVRRTVSELLEKGSSVKLPPWPLNEEGKPVSEEHYNEKTVPDYDCRFLCLNTKTAVTPVHDGKGIELCDLLGPNDEIVHIKQASAASKLSHLFIQVRAAVESLRSEPEAREWFRERVAELAPGRRPPQMPPRTVVFGIRLSAHSEVTFDTLYPLARVELYRTALALRRFDVDVQVVGIRHA